MKIIVISVISPEKEGRLNKTLSFLATQHDVTLVSPGNCNNSNVSFIQVGDKRPVGLREQIRYVKKIRNRVKKLPSGSCFDIIFIANILSVPGGMCIKRFFHINKVVYDAYELFFNMKSKRMAIKNRIYLLMERYIINKCELVIEANSERALLAQGYYRLDKRPAVMTNFNYITDESPIIVSKPISNKIILGYIGFVSRERMIDKVIENISNDPDIEFHIYGNGSDLKSIHDESIEKGYSNVYFHGEYKLDDLRTILSSIDIGYINYPFYNYNNMYCEPNKIYEYCANSIPMISYKHPKLENIFNSYNIGCATDCLQPTIHYMYNQLTIYKNACVDFYKAKVQEVQFERDSLLASIEHLTDC